MTDQIITQKLETKPQRRKYNTRSAAFQRYLNVPSDALEERRLLYDYWSLYDQRAEAEAILEEPGKYAILSPAQARQLIDKVKRRMAELYELLGYKPGSRPKMKPGRKTTYLEPIKWPVEKTKLVTITGETLFVTGYADSAYGRLLLYKGSKSGSTCARLALPLLAGSLLSGVRLCSWPDDELVMVDQLGQREAVVTKSRRY